MSGVVTNLIGAKASAQVKRENDDGAGPDIVHGTIAVVCYTGDGLTLWLAVPTGPTYRHSPQGQKLVRVHWTHITEVTYP